MYWVTGILGLALAVAPYVFGYADNTTALWTSLLLGGGTAIVSFVEWMRAGREEWEYWAVGIMGLAAIVAPFIFQFSAEVAATWTTVVVGILIAVFAGSKLTTSEWGKA